MPINSKMLLSVVCQKKVVYLKTIVHTKIACNNPNKIKDALLHINMTLFHANKNKLLLQQKTSVE